MLSLAVFCAIQLKLHVCEDALTRKLQHSIKQMNTTTRYFLGLSNKMMIFEPSFLSRAISIILSCNNSEFLRGVAWRGTTRRGSGHALVGKLLRLMPILERVESTRYFVFLSISTVYIRQNHIISFLNINS